MKNGKYSSPVMRLGRVYSRAAVSMLALLAAWISNAAIAHPFPVKNTFAPNETDLAVECVGVNAFTQAAKCVTHKYVRPAPGDYIEGFPNVRRPEYADPNYGYYRWPLPTGYGAVICLGAVVPGVPFRRNDPCGRTSHII